MMNDEYARFHHGDLFFIHNITRGYIKSGRLVLRINNPTMITIRTKIVGK